MICCVIIPGAEEANMLDIKEISSKEIENILGGKFSILQVPGLKEKNIDVFSLKSVRKDESPSIIVINENTEPLSISDAILGKVVLLGVDEDDNTVPLSEDQMKYLVTCNEFASVGTLGGKIEKKVLSFRVK